MKDPARHNEIAKREAQEADATYESVGMPDDFEDKSVLRVIEQLTGQSFGHHAVTRANVTYQQTMDEMGRQERELMQAGLRPTDVYFHRGVMEVLKDAMRASAEAFAPEHVRQAAIAYWDDHELGHIQSACGSGMLTVHVQTGSNAPAIIVVAANQEVKRLP